MTRNSVGKATLAGWAVALLVAGALSLVCAGRDLELIVPVVSETLQYRTDDFVIFFSPAIDDEDIAGLTLSITSTLVDAMSIEWRESYFILPSGERSDAITSDIPTSFQMNPTDIYARQTVEIVAIPLSHVSRSGEGWSIATIDAEEGDEMTIHLAIRGAGGDEAPASTGYDFTFRAIETEEPAERAAGRSRWFWPALLGTVVGFLLGLLATEL